VKSIPLPLFTVEQIDLLAVLQEKIVSMEHDLGTRSARAYLDEQLAHILKLPESITMLATEFVQLRLNLVSGGTKEAIQSAQQYPDEQELSLYAQQLTHELDGFLDSGKTHHRITIEYSHDLICCTVEFVKSEHPFIPVVQSVSPDDRSAFYRLQQNLRQRFSQWVYVQRGLKMFGPSSVSFFKAPHLICWTRTQAMNDAGEIIGEILAKKRH